MTLPSQLSQTVPSLPSVIERLAEIPAEEIWLANQKSARTRRAGWLDVPRFIATLCSTATHELRQVKHRAVIAWGSDLGKSPGRQTTSELTVTRD
jgi:hypothetical protein